MRLTFRILHFKQKVGGNDMFNQKFKDTMDFIASTLGTDVVFFQDTETSGEHEESKIYELAGVLYNRATQTATPIHYYLPISSKEMKKFLNYNGITPELKQAYSSMRSKAKGSYQGGKYVPEDKVDAILGPLFSGGVTHIAYNALFDTSKEVEQLKGKFPGGIYDAQTIVLNYFPQILQAADIKRLGKNGQPTYGHWNMELVYDELCKPETLKAFGINKHFPSSYGRSKRTGSQLHQAYSDVVDYLIPVMGAMTDIFNKLKQVNPGLNIRDMRNVIATTQQFVVEKQIRQEQLLNSTGTTRAAFSPKQLKAMGGNAAGWIENLQKQQKSQKSLDSFEDVVRFIGASGSGKDILSGKQVHQRIINTVEASKHKAMFALTKDLEKQGRNNTEVLLGNINSKLEQCGFEVRYQFHQATGQLEYALFPSTGEYWMTNSEPLKFFVNLSRKDGTITMNGQKSVNKLFSDYVGGKTVIITAEQAQLLDLLEVVEETRSRGSIGDYKRFERRLNNTVRKAMQTVHALQNYVPGEALQDSAKEMFGTGSNRQRLIRENILDNSRYLAKIVNQFSELTISCRRQNFPGINTNEKAKEKIIKDLNTLLNMSGVYSGNSWLKKIDANRYQYLLDTKTWQDIIVKEFPRLGALGFQPGLTSDNSVLNFSTSLLSPRALSTADISRITDRYAAQEANTKILSAKARSEREKRRPHSFNPELLNSGYIHTSDAEEALATFGFATDKDVRDAYEDLKQEYIAKHATKGMNRNQLVKEFEKEFGTFVPGMHNSGGIYSLGSSFETYMDSYTQKAGKVERQDFDAMCDRLLAARYGKNVKWEDLTQEETEKRLTEFYERAKQENKLESIEKRALHILLKREIGVKNTIFDYGYSGNFVRCLYTIPSPMRSGTKVLIQGTGGRSRQTLEAANKALFNKILENKGLSKHIEFLMEAPGESVSSKELEGTIIPYLNAIFDAACAKKSKPQPNMKKNTAGAYALLSQLNSPLSPLAGIYQFDSAHRAFIAKHDGWVNTFKNKSLDKIMTFLSNLGREYLSGPGFIYDKNSKSWHISNFYVGKAAVNQANIDDYGDPSDPSYFNHEIVSADYRNIQALESAGQLARRVTGHKNTQAINYYVKQMSVPESEKRKLAQLQKTISENRKLSLTSTTYQNGVNAKDYEQLLASAVKVGIGPQYDVDITKFSTEIYKDKKFDITMFNESVFGEIDRKKKEKKTDQVYIDLENVAVKMEKTGSTGAYKTAAMRFLFLTDFMPFSPDWADMENPDFPSSFSKVRSLISSMKDYADYKGTSHAASNSARVGQRAFEVLEAEEQMVSYKESALYQKYNKRRLTHSGSFTATAPNVALLTNQYGVESYYKNISSTSSVGNWEDVRNMLIQDEVSSDVSAKQATKLRQGHLAVLKSTLLDIYNIDDVNKNKDLVEKIQKALADYVVYGYLDHNAKLNALKSKRGVKEQEITALARELGAEARSTLLPAVQDLVFGDKKTSLGAYEKINGSKELYNKVNDFLSSFITESVTIGSLLFDLQGDANHKRGIANILSRYPYSNGLDMKFSGMYVDNGVVKGKIVIGLGTGISFNLDFDGDHPPAFLSMLSPTGLGASPEVIERRWKLLRRQTRTSLEKWQNQINSVLAVYASQDINPLDDLKVFKNKNNFPAIGQKGVIYYADDEQTSYSWNEKDRRYAVASLTGGKIEKSEIEEFIKFKEQVEAAMTGRENKTHTGSLSNIYQAVANEMHKHQLDEMALEKGATEENIRKAIRAIIVRAFYESLTQDAISSKKVFQRLKQQSADHRVDTESYINDVSDLVNMLKQQQTYTDNGLNILFHKLEEMGLKDIQDRIVVQVMMNAALLDKKGKVFKEVFGVDRSALDFLYDEQGFVSGYGKTEGGEAIKRGIQSLQSVVSNNFTQDVVRKSLSSLVSDFDALNLTSKKGRGAGISYVINNPDSKPGSHQYGFSDYSENYDILVKQADDLAKRQLVQYKAQLDKEIGEIKERKTKVLGTNSTFVKFQNTLKDYKKALQDPQNKKSIVALSVATGLDTGYNPFTGRLKHNTYFKEPNKYLEKLQQNGRVFSATQIAGALYIGAHGTESYATKYGSLHHKILEALYGIEEELPLSFGENQTEFKNNLREWLFNKFNKGDNEDKYLTSIAIDENGAVNEKVLEDLATSTYNFKQLAEESGLLSSDLKVEIEKTYGILVSLGDKEIVISGTIDQLWNGLQGNQSLLTDAKTSKFPYLEYVIQMGLYSAILRAAGYSMTDQARLFMTSGSGSRGIVDIDILSDEELFNFVKDAVQVLECKNEEQRWVMIMQMNQKWNHVLNKARHMDFSMTGDITDSGVAEEQLFLGGTKLSDVFNGLGHEFRLTKEEQDLVNIYNLAGEGKTFEEFVYSAYKEGKYGITKEVYDQHILFRNARAQYLNDFLDTFGSEQDSRRQLVLRTILNYANGSPTDIRSDFANAYHKQYGLKLDENSILNFTSAHNITGSSYYYSDLGFKATEEEDEVTKEELMAIFSEVVNKLGGTSAESPAGQASPGHYNPVGDNATILGTSDQARYLAEYKKYKIGEMAEGKHDEEKHNEILAKIKSSYTINGELNEELYNAAIKKADEDLAKDNEYIKAKNKLLADQAKIYEEIYNLQTKIKRAERLGHVDEESRLRKELRYTKKERITFADLKRIGISDAEIKAGIKDPASIGSGAGAGREEDAARIAALKRYRSLTLERGRIDASIKDLTLTHRVTYDKLYRSSIEQNIEDTMMQREYTEQEIKQITDQYLNDPEFQKQMEIVDKEVNIKNAVRNSRVDVKHKGRDSLWGQLASQMTNMLTRFTQMGAAYKILGNVRQGFNTVIQSAKNLDKALTDLRIVTGKTGDQARSTMSDFAKLAGQLGVTTTEVASAGTAWFNRRSRPMAVYKLKLFELLEVPKSL